MGKGSGLPCQPGGNASPGGGPPHRAAPQARGGCRSTDCDRVGQGGPSRGRPGRNPTRPWRWIASSGTLPATAIPTSLTSVSQGAAHVVVLSLCEAAKREFGGFVQRVFRGFTSTIKLGVFEHPIHRSDTIISPKLPSRSADLGPCMNTYIESAAVGGPDR